MIIKYKLFEGKYQNISKKISDYLNMIDELNKSYKDDVKECLYDIVDNYDSSYIDEPEEDEDPLSVFLEVKVKFEDIDKFFKDYKECNHKVESYIGRTIKFEHFGITLQNLNFISIEDLNYNIVDINKMNIDDKVSHVVSNIKRSEHLYSKRLTGDYELLIILGV